MTDDKKHDDKDRKKLSDEEMEDVAGGFTNSDWTHDKKKRNKRSNYIDLPDGNS